MVHKQIENFKNIANTQEKLLTLYEGMIDNTVERKERQWSLNAITVIHKSYEHSKSLIASKYNNEKVKQSKEIILRIAWEKYISYFELSSSLSGNDLLISSSSNNPRLQQLVNSELLPILRQKEHITEKYKLGECMEIQSKVNKRPQSSQNKRNNHIVRMAYDRKEAIEMNKQLLVENDMNWKSKEVNIKRNQLISRTYIKHLSSYLYTAYNGLIYHIKNVKSNKELIQLSKIECNTKFNKIYLITGKEFELIECTVNDLIKQNTLYVLEKTSLCSLNSGEDKMYLRKLSNVEIEELMFIYTGASSYPMHTVEELFGGLDGVFAWIKSNEGGNKQFLIRLHEDNNKIEQKAKYCRWPSCCLFGDVKNCKESNLVSIKFNMLISSPLNSLEVLLPNLDLYKTSKRIVSKTNNKVNYCSFHRSIASTENLSSV